MSAGKAFLMGMFKGGLKSNNERAQRMEERMLALADQNATMARERAKSAYDRTVKEAQAITSTEAQLKTNGFIDQEGNYTTKYYDNEAVTAWADPDTRKALGADGDFKAFRDKWAVLKKKERFVNPYKSPEQREADLSKLYQSIATKHQVESTQPVLTGLDKLFMKGTSSAINTVGAGVNKVTDGAVDVESSFVPRESQEVPELAEASPMRTPAQKATDEPYVSPNFDIPTKVDDWTVTPFRNAIDATTGEVLGNVFTFVDGTKTKNMQRLEDGSWFEVNVSSRPTTEEGEKTRSNSPKLNDVQQARLSRYDRVNRVQRLAIELAKDDYKGNPKDFIFRNLSVIKDVVGATFNLTGDHNADLEAVTSYVNDTIDKKGLRDLIGPLDTAAVVQGDREALTKFLTYATADMFNEGGRITVASTDAAKSLMTSFIEGTITQDAKLSSLAKQAQSEMLNITRDSLSEAQNDLKHPLWDSFPNIRKQISAGVNMRSSISGGMALTKEVSSLKDSNPDAYQKTINNLKQHVGTTDPTALSNPVFMHRELGLPVVIMYQQNDEGVYNFRLVPIK